MLLTTRVIYVIVEHWEKRIICLLVLFFSWEILCKNKEKKTNHSVFSRSLTATEKDLAASFFLMNEFGD